MQRFNAIKNLIVAPALVIALTAGSALAGPGQHFGGAAHHGAKIGRPEMSLNLARQTPDIRTHATGKIANGKTDPSPLGATQNVGTSASDDQVLDVSPLSSSVPLIEGVTFYFLELPEFDFDARALVNILDPDLRHIPRCKMFGC
ncbi:hypothetical protein RKLH11_3261 [Rhodobacteraceae bacterium KLH11]|nr:hypothetical protein RKLH11_3261 [Rhodobacteraceae bacterium KLH11]